ncbi:tetratricopeptide repeat protein, partial [bacterium]|nr:tetratricopeptide repeat protein [bacterium]
MKLIGFLLFLFVGMSSVSFGQQDIYKQVDRFYNAVDKSNTEQVIELGNSIFDYIEYNKIPTDTSVVDLLLNVGYYLQNFGDYATAIEVYQSLQDRIDYEWGPDYIDYHITILNMARLHNQLGNFNNAVLLHNQLLEIYKKRNGDRSFEVAVVYLDLHSTYQSLGDFEKAIDCNFKAQSIQREMGKDGLKGLATSLNDISITYRKINKYRQAIECLEESVKIRREIYGEISVEYAQALGNLSNVYSDMDEVDKALKYIIQSLNISEKIHGRQSHIYALLNANMGYLYYKKGDFDKALKLYFESKPIYENTIGTKHGWYASLLQNISLTYSSMRKYEASLFYQKKAIAINQGLYGKWHHKVSTSISNLGSIYKHMGVLDSALICYNEALIIDKELHLDSSMVYVFDLGNLGLVNQNMGEYSKAIEKYEQALPLCKFLIGENNTSYFDLKINLANVYCEVGNLKLAVALIQEYIDIDNFSFGSNARLASNLLSLSQIHLANQEYEVSLKYIDRALHVREKEYGKNNSTYIGYLNSKLLVLSESKTPQECIKMAKNNYKLANKYCSASDIIHHVAQSNLAIINYQIGNYQDALKLGIEQIENSKIDTLSETYLVYLDNLTAIAYAAGQPMLSKKYLFDAIPLKLSRFNKNRFGLSRQEVRNVKKQFCSYLFSKFDVFMNDYNAIQRFFQIWIDINAILNSDIARINDLELHHSSDTTLVKLVDSYKSDKAYLNSIYERPNDQFENKQELVDSLTKKSDALEKLLSRKSQLFTDAYRDISITDLANHLNQREFYIDIIKIDKFNLYTDSWLDSTQYLVFIVDSNDTLVDYVLIEDG